MGRRHGMWRVTFNHLACWLNIESMMWDEGFVAIEETVPAGQQVAFEPALATCARSTLSMTRPSGDTWFRPSGLILGSGCPLRDVEKGGQTIGRRSRPGRRNAGHDGPS